MKTLSLLLVLCLSLFAELNYQKLLDSISSHAIRMGTGENRSYVFIDPICQKSRNFIAMIDADKELQKKISYYIFLYEIKRFDSKRLIQYIYEAESPLETLKDVMIYDYHDEEDPFVVTEKTITKIDDIAKIGKKIGMDQRPFILSFQAGSDYCDITSGTAPCLEENEFKK